MTRPPPSSPFFPSPPLSRSPRIAPPRPAPAIARASARGARAHPPRRASSCERALQDSRHHPATVEVLLGEAAREATVSLRSEEHTSELQSQSNLVCRLLLEK